MPMMLASTISVAAYHVMILLSGIFAQVVATKAHAGIGDVRDDIQNESSSLETTIWDSYYSEHYAHL